MPHSCPVCERTFLEEYLLANHEIVVHSDEAVAIEKLTPALGAYIGSVDPVAITEAPHLMSIFAFDVTAPERRRLVKITGSPEDGFKTELVSDYNEIMSLLDEDRVYSDKQAGVKIVGGGVDSADADDPPEQQMLLMQAWQAMALYLSNADDTDQEPAMQILKMVSNLMSGSGSDVDQPPAAGAFGLVSRAMLDISGNTYDCPQCSRDFASEQGLINHLKQLHAAREKQTTMRTEND